MYPEWFTSEIIRDIKKKAEWHIAYKMSGNPYIYNIFSYYRALVKRKIHDSYKSYRSRIENQFISDPRSFWGFVKNKRSKRKKPHIVQEDNILPESECASAFSKYFASVYDSDIPRLNAEEAARVGSSSADYVHVPNFTLKDVVIALRRLKPKKSVGPDQIPPFIVKDCFSVLAEPLLHLFNLSLSTYTYPKQWKTTRVIPVPKGGSISEVSNYRPVAIPSTFAKLFESILYKSIYSQINSRLSNSQHGFRPGHGTHTNLISFVQYTTSALDQRVGGQVDVAYFDYRKAFDTVNNDILLEKFAKFGFTLGLLKFFANYLRERKQYVEFNGTTSETYVTNSGVSQGSNLGPLAFLLMINDLPNVVKESKCLLFADDLKLYVDVNNLSDCERLQRDIDRVVLWSYNNKLEFNIGKTNIMSCSRAQEPFCYEYEIDGVPLSRVTSVRDLGVQISADLTFKDHIIKICKAAFRNLGFVIRQTKELNNVIVLKVLFNALVRSKLETCAIIWNPHELKYISMIEKIQNKFLRHMYLRQFGVYPYYPLMYPTLFLLGMVGYYKLEIRRNLVLVTYIFKVFRGQLHNTTVLDAIGLQVPNRRLRRGPRDQVFAIPHCRTNIQKFAPVTRALTILNEISMHVDIFHCSLGKFTEIALKYFSNNL